MASKSWTSEARGYIGVCEICGKNVFLSYIKEGDKVYHKKCYLKSKGLIQSKNSYNENSTNNLKLK